MRASIGAVKRHFVPSDSGSGEGETDEGEDSRGRGHCRSRRGGPDPFHCAPAWAGAIHDRLDVVPSRLF